MLGMLFANLVSANRKGYPNFIAPKNTMSTKKKRFVFTEFKTLQHISFEKLEKVCDKLFVLIRPEEQQIPFPLVLAMQRMGKNAKWIVAKATDTGSLEFHLSFLLGKLDEKLDLEIEFAILSGSTNLDPVVDFINQSGRNCLRVTVEETEAGFESEVYEEETYLIDEESEEYETESDLQIDLSESGTSKSKEESSLGTAVSTEPSKVASKEDIEGKALETVQRLQYTGNRPAEVILLRDYIALFHQGIEDDDGQADQIINKLVEDKQIEVRKGIIKYNF